ncbi:MAG: hypothetical protein R2705_01590 [Ilumatobacteraceae bacterium]
MSAVVSSPPRLLLAEAPPRFGRISKRLLARLIVAIAFVEVAGAVLIASGGRAARAAGASLVFPGVGFLVDAAPVMFGITLVLVVVALVLWWGLSAHVAIPLVWLGSALGAALLADGPRLWTSRGTQWPWAIWVAPVLALAFVGWAVQRVERRYRAKRAKVPELNEYLRTAELPAKIETRRDPDAMDAELLRWCYSFAFQPDDDLQGLQWGEQFHGGTQLRYQMNSLAWAMSLYAANFLPNAPGQIAEALDRVVAKHTDLRVWGYWRTLNLLGNFDPNPDPIRRDNIMFSAFLGDVINTAEAATGTTRFDEPGSLTFVWKDGRTFPYDHHSIAEAVRANYRRSRLGFFPCEPGWSFTVCNVMGAQALRNHDALHGTADWDEIREDWQRALDEEYLTPDGSYAHIRSNHVGLSWDTGEVPGGHYFANGTHRFADILPDHAERARALDLRLARPKMQALATMVRDGHLDLELPEELERHRTASSPVLPWIKVIGGARLAGEDELVQASIAASAKQGATGERWPERPVKIGGAGLGSYMLVRWSQPLDLAALNLRGYVEPTGPVLDSWDWERVFVSLARPVGDGGLELCIEPWDGPVDATLSFRSLRPGATHVMRGSRSDLSFVADATGCASVTVPDVRVATPLSVEVQR